MKLGIHTNQPMAEYLAIKAFSSGMANTILSQSVRHALFDSPWNPNRKPRNSDDMDLGTYAHACLLEGGHDGLVVIEADDWRTKAAKEARDAAYASGRLPILAKKLPQVDLMVKAAKEYIASSEIADAFDTGAPEQTLLWNEEGIMCKARPDWLTADGTWMVHYKTTAGSAEPESWIRNQLTAMGYDLALVLYERGLYAIDGDGKDAPTSVFLVQETKEPYACSLISLAPAAYQLAEQKLARAFDLWKRALATNRFDAYPTRICYAEPKPWELAEQEERDMRFTESELSGGIPL